MQSDLTNYIRQISDAGGGGGGSFANPNTAYQAFAPTDFQRGIANWGTGQMGNQFSGPVEGMNPWQQSMVQTVANNPAVQGLQAPTAQSFQGLTTPEAAGPSNMLQGMPQAQGVGSFQSSLPTAVGGQVNPYSMQQLGSFSPEAFNSDRMLQAAQNNMQRIIAPQLAQNAVAGGSNPMSGAYAEAMANASAGMALPITQQISQQQYGATMPQLNAAMQSQLQQQGAQQGFQGMGLQGNIQGALAQQGAQNQMLGQGYGGSIQSMLQNQGAQDQLISQGFGANLQGGLNQQQAQNAMLSQGYGGQLQGLLNQGQNQFQYGMSLPQQQAQFLSNIQGTAQNQMNLQGLDQQARANAYLNAQNQWAQAMSSLSNTSFTNPGMNTYQSTPGQGFNIGGSMTGALGGAATGAMMGSVVPGLGTGIGALIGGGMGLMGGGFCWIADALYGEGSEEALAARHWVSNGWTGPEADAFREWYKDRGPELARQIREGEMSDIRVETYRMIFDEFVQLGRGSLAHAI